MTVSVPGFADVTKLVTVHRSGFTNVCFSLNQPDNSVPQIVMMCIVSTAAMSVMLCALYCFSRRRRRRERRSSSRYRFQPLSQSSGGNVFHDLDMDDDDEEEEFEFLSKDMTRIGSKMSTQAPRMAYRDSRDSSSSDEHESLLSNGHRISQM